MDSTFTVCNDKSSSEEEIKNPSSLLSFSTSSEEEEEEEEQSSSKGKTGRKNSGAKQSGTSRSVKRTRLSFADMVVTAVKSNSDPKGASLPSIKSYLKEQYLIDEAKLKRYLKQSMEKCLETEMIVRCKTKKNKEQTGMRGRFRFNETAKQPGIEDGGKKMSKQSKSDVNKKASKLSSVIVDKSKLQSLKRKSSTTQKLAMKRLRNARKSLSSAKKVPKATTTKTRKIPAKVSAKAQSPTEACVEVKSVVGTSKGGKTAKPTAKEKEKSGKKAKNTSAVKKKNTKEATITKKKTTKTQKKAATSKQKR